MIAHIDKYCVKCGQMVWIVCFLTFVTVVSDFINVVQYKNRSGKPVYSHQYYQEKDHLKFH